MLVKLVTPVAKGTLIFPPALRYENGEGCGFEVPTNSIGP
jgi:hypothetical protein